MIETYQDEIAELLDTLSDDIEQQRDADWANEGGNIHLDEGKQ